jgi:undecaprenyl-diphosphatase
VIPADHHLALEERIFRAVNVDAGSWVDGLARTLSSPVFGVTLGVLLAIALWVHRRERGWRWVLALGIALALTDALGSQVLRPLLLRARPVYALPPGTVRYLSPAANSGSIPSLHAANFFAMAVVGAVGWPALAPLLFSLATAVAWSRLYVGVHWPGDVLLGALWGSLWGLASVTFLRRMLARNGRGP